MSTSNKIRVGGSWVDVSDVMNDDGLQPVDGEVTNAATLLTAADDPSNAGKTFYMRGGSYGSLDFSGTPGPRPSSLITFIVYPGETVTVSSMTFRRTANIRLDGNSYNRNRLTSTYGLRVTGTIVLDEASPDWNDNIQLANLRIGGNASAIYAEWPKQHGIMIREYTRDFLLEDFEISYLFSDGSEGDFTSGGVAIFPIAGSGDEDKFGTHTIRRGWVHHIGNDCFQHNAAGGTWTFDRMLVEDVQPYDPLAHSDVLQVQGSAELVVTNCVFRDNFQFIVHGYSTAPLFTPRVLDNVLILNMTNSPVFGKGDAPGPYPADPYTPDWWTIQDITLWDGAGSIRLEGQATDVKSNVLKNSIIEQGIASVNPGVTVIANVLDNDGEANCIPAGTGLAGDITTVPTFNANWEATNVTQGWRKPSDFPFPVS